MRVNIEPAKMRMTNKMIWRMRKVQRKGPPREGQRNEGRKMILMILLTLIAMMKFSKIQSQKAKQKKKDQREHQLK